LHDQIEIKAKLDVAIQLKFGLFFTATLSLGLGCKKPQNTESNPTGHNHNPITQLSKNTKN